ncbi:hypothetical protein E9229_001275 [Paeniglutamicibacter cryotolerans]|uniref:Uncharacterized protein n=1 Tax=Paeniglutamicibacter cryotolerans TaxID=670079 RepID=A0A839QK08_9MICC|nr:hypothetical protein [Paeniglutamicibacter cryotolerans]
MRDGLRMGLTLLASGWIKNRVPTVHPQDVGVVGRHVQRMHNDNKQMPCLNGNEMDSKDVFFVQKMLRIENVASLNVNLTGGY